MYTSRLKKVRKLNVRAIDPQAFQGRKLNVRPLFVQNMQKGKEKSAAYIRLGFNFLFLALKDTRFSKTVFSRFSRGVARVLFFIP